MNSEIYSFALKNTLNEISGICPDIKNSFVFKEDGEIIATDQSTPERTIVQVIDSLETVLEKAATVGGFDEITIESSNGTLRVSCMNKLYFATVTSINADRNYVNTVSRVLVPTIIKLLEKITSVPLRSNLYGTDAKQTASVVDAAEEQAQEVEKKSALERPRKFSEPEAEHVPKSEPVLEEPLASQFIVENIGGLLVPADTVRVDNSILEQWQQLYEDKRIEEVEIETFGGKATQCKVKPIKDSKYIGKGIVQMPEKVQAALETKKGELVRVKPLVEY